MHVFKTFFRVARNYKAGIIMYSAIIIGMLIIFNSSRTSSENTKVVQKRYTLIVVDEDNSDVSNKLIEYLNTRHTLKKGSFSDDQIRDLLYYQRISEYIVIPKGFGDSFDELMQTSSSDKKPSSLLQATYDDALPRGIFINMQIDEYLNALSGYMKQGKTIDEASHKAYDILDTDSFVSSIEKSDNTMDVVYTAFTFLPFGILSIIFSGVMPVILSFKEKEKKNRMAISKTKMTNINISLIAGTIVVAITVTILLIVFATIPAGIKYAFTTKWWLAVLNTIVYTITITMLLSMITSLPLGIGKKGSGNTASFITNIIGLGFAFLGGTFVDLTILGDEVAKVGRFTPNYWYSIASHKIWMNGAGLTDVIGDYGIILLFGIVCLSIGLAFTKYFGDKIA